MIPNGVHSRGGNRAVSGGHSARETAATHGRYDTIVVSLSFSLIGAWRRILHTRRTYWSRFGLRTEVILFFFSEKTVRCSDGV